MSSTNAVAVARPPSMSDWWMRRISVWTVAALVGLVMGVGALLAPSASAQDALVLTNRDTQVSGVSFRFPQTRTFEDERLIALMVTRAPGLTDRIRNALPLLSGGVFPFDPVELQRDMARLRRFYARNGFPDARVDYPASQFNAEKNQIRVIVTIHEGPPTALGTLEVVFTDRLAPDVNEAWERERMQLDAFAGERFTDFERLTIENTVLSLLQDRGHAFASVESRMVRRADEPVVDVEVTVRPGPRARIEAIEIEGNDSVSDQVVLRELPFGVGDIYARRRLIEGQQQLFGLNLFRLALADLPEQESDSSVVVRYRLREANIRFLAIQGGFSRETGLSLDGEIRHRNFLGGARELTLATDTRTGLFSSPASGRKPVRSVSTNLSLRQPYLGSTRLSGSLSPFYSWLDEPNQDTRFFEFGLTTALVWELLPFRNLSAQHTLSRAVPLEDRGFGERIDVYNRSVFSAGLAVGNLDDYLTPGRGWIVRPSGSMGGLLGGAVEFVKGQIDALFFLPLSGRFDLLGSVSVGRLSPRGASREQTNAQNEFRFDAIRFYAGGSNDVRGWGLNALGPQVAVADSVFVNADGRAVADNARFEAIGGLAKASFRSELRSRVPGLGSAWRVAVFLDGGAIPTDVRRTDAGATQFSDERIALFRDRNVPRGSDFRFGSGAGIRYRTPVGMLRLDLAWKLNPSRTDLRNPEDIVLWEAGLLESLPGEKQIRRLNLHLSIDRAF